jgi:hypothetical protein
MTKRKDITPIRSYQIRQIDVIDDADWLTEQERVLRYEEEIEECLLVVVPKDIYL